MTTNDYIGRNNNRYTVSQLNYISWKLAGPDLNYETATRLEVEGS